VADVRFTAKADKHEVSRLCPLCANRDLTHCSKQTALIRSPSAGMMGCFRAAA